MNAGKELIFIINVTYFCRVKHSQAFLLLGSNIGDREKFLSEAISLIEKKLGTIVSKSSLYNTKAWGARSERRSIQSDFLNQAICLKTSLPSEKLLKEILLIETKMGRTRKKKWESRTIDIDILFFNTEIINTPELTVPHPFLHKRRFALVPLNEICGGFVHPQLRKTIKILLKECDDKLDVSMVIK